MRQKHQYLQLKLSGQKLLIYKLSKCVQYPTLSIILSIYFKDFFTLRYKCSDLFEHEEKLCYSALIPLAIQEIHGSAQCIKK